MVGSPTSDHARDIAAILARRHANGGDYWASAEGRWGIGAPFSTFDCALMLHELGLDPADPVADGVAGVMFGCWQEDGRIRPGPKLPVFPCQTANAARVLGRLGRAGDPRLQKTFAHLLEGRHTDGGWRCATARLGRSPDMDASNPGVTLSALDALRYAPPNDRADLDEAVETLLAHWRIRRPMGPCQFGIGSRFMALEFPFFRYNLFFWVYVLSFYPRAHGADEFREALARLEDKVVDGAVRIEAPRRGWKELEFCRQGVPCDPATRRYEEIRANLAR